MGFRNREPRVGGLFFRILLMANFIAMMAYGAITPSQMTKVTAEVVTIAITAVGMVVQVYVAVARFISLPYSIWAVIALDSVCAAGWVAAIAVLAYWDRDVVYFPRDGDPDAWFQCASTHSYDQVLTSDGYGSWIKILWCEVDVDGRHRLIGNKAARQQLHVLIGLATVALVFTGFLIFYTVARGRSLNLIRTHRRARAPY